MTPTENLQLEIRLLNACIKMALGFMDKGDTWAARASLLVALGEGDD